MTDWRRDCWTIWRRDWCDPAVEPVEEEREEVVVDLRGMCSECSIAKNGRTMICV
jgi:Fe-S cluster biogenesis protein NfuA